MQKLWKPDWTNFERQELLDLGHWAHDCENLSSDRAAGADLPPPSPSVGANS